MRDDRREVSFDELAKGLASGDLTRGKALRLMGAALLGGTLASVPGIAVAAPKPRPNGRKCKQSSQCLSGNCQGGVCQAAGCPSGTTECNGSCVTNCTSGQVLDPSTCTCVCPTGTVLDNGQCVSPSPQQCSFPGTCATGGLGPCGTTSYGATCYCYTTATGAGACLPGRTESGTGVAEEPTCPNGQTDCPTGTVCVVETCGTNPNHCVPVPVSPVCA
jgi:hypothetical protein